MPSDIKISLRDALTKLESERAHIDRQVAAIRDALAAFGGATSGSRATAPAATRKPRSAMSAAARKAIGKRMKAYWAKRRAAKATGSAKSAKTKASK